MCAERQVGRLEDGQARQDLAHTYLVVAQVGWVAGSSLGHRLCWGGAGGPGRHVLYSLKHLPSGFLDVALGTRARRCGEVPCVQNSEPKDEGPTHRGDSGESH